MNEVEIEVTVRLKKPHPAQQNFLDTRRRFNVLKCGRRFGKTEVAQILIFEGFKDAHITGYFAPTYKDLFEVWQTAKTIFHDIIEHKDEQMKQMRFCGGAKVDFWSMDDPDSGRGRKYHRVIIDECEKAAKFQEAWEQTIRATLTDYAGDGYFLSTPQFGDTFFKKLCKYEQIHTDWITFIYTTYDNPHIDPKEIDQARSLLDPLVFDCEYLALDVDGKVLNPFAYQFDQVYHVSDAARFNPARRLIIAIDFNMQPFAVSFSHLWEDVQGYHEHIFDEAEIPKGSIPHMIDLIGERYQGQLSSAQITGDYMGNRGELSQRDNSSLYTQLIRGLKMGAHQLKLTPNPLHMNSKADCNWVLWKSKQPGSKFEYLVHPQCKGTIRDFNGVQYDDLKNEIVKRNRKDITQHADLLDTRRYVVNTFWKPIIKRHQIS